MNKITKISIVCAQGAATYEVGAKGIIEFKEEVVQIAEDARASFIYGVDKDGTHLVEISAAAPTVIERF